MRTLVIKIIVFIFVVLSLLGSCIYGVSLYTDLRQQLITIEQRNQNAFDSLVDGK
jgi:hypothetical protein